MKLQAPVVGSATTVWIGLPWSLIVIRLPGSAVPAKVGDGSFVTPLAAIGPVTGLLWSVTSPAVNAGGVRSTTNG